jgi:hypothetical protein
MHDYRKCKAQENNTPQAPMSTDLTQTPTIYNYNKANEYFQKNFTGNAFIYACKTCDRSWYMNDLKKLNENTKCISSRFSRLGCCSV